MGRRRTAPGRSVRLGQQGLDPDHDGDDVVVTWRERGGPPVTPPEKRSFGTNLIERSLDVFRGSARIDFAADGIVCRMRFPRTNVAQAE